VGTWRPWRCADPAACGVGDGSARHSQARRPASAAVATGQPAARDGKRRPRLRWADPDGGHFSELRRRRRAAGNAGSVANATATAKRGRQRRTTAGK
jgi:hypothetical protein